MVYGTTVHTTLLSLLFRVFALYTENYSARSAGAVIGLLWSLTAAGLFA